MIELSPVVKRATFAVKSLSASACLDAGNPRCQNDVVAIALVVDPGAAAESIADRQVAAVDDANIVALASSPATLTTPTAAMPISLPAVSVPVARKSSLLAVIADIGSGGDRSEREAGLPVMLVA